MFFHNGNIVLNSRYIIKGYIHLLLHYIPIAEAIMIPRHLDVNSIKSILPLHCIKNEQQDKKQ